MADLVKVYRGDDVELVNPSALEQHLKLGFKRVDDAFRASLAKRLAEEHAIVAQKQADIDKAVAELAFYNQYHHSERVASLERIIAAAAPGNA